MKPMPASRMHVPTWSASRSILTPSACKTSAAPDFEESARFPCLATGTPAPATMNAAQVEMLNEPEASPPVPTTSIAPGGALTPSILLRIVVTAPVISSTVSPRTRSAIRSPPICDGVASPDIMRSKAAAASSRVRVAPVATLAMSALKSSATSGPSSRQMESGRRARRRGARPVPRVPRCSNIKKVFEHKAAVLGGNAFGMKLNSVDRQVAMHDPHHKAIGTFRVDCQITRHTGALHHQRMVARCLQRSINAAKYSGPGMPDFRKLPVEGSCPHDFSAKGLPDGLVAEAYPEDWNAGGRFADEIEANAGFVGRAGAGRENDRIGLQRHDVADRNLVVAMDDHVRPQPSQIVEEVEGEAVIVVDQDNHVPPLCQGFTVPPQGGQAVGFCAGYWPRLAALAKRRASSAARNKAFALLMHSCCSKSGSLSATMPAPAWTYMVPSLIRAVRKTMHVSISPPAEK